MIGSPGIGKTMGGEDYPIASLSEVNSNIASKTIPKFKFRYVNPFDENTIEKQSIDQLNETRASEEDKNKILRFDGKPFLADELKKEIERRLK